MVTNPSTKTISKKKIWTGARAIAEAVKIADVDVISAYPIRPYTGIMNSLAKMIADGEFKAEIVVADSEHSQFEIVKHASAVGARTFAGSSGVGLAFGSEAIITTALGQLPVVAVAGCRALDDPGNFGMEWNDVLMFRDIGWLISWAKDSQEALDMTLVAYRTAEDKNVLLPHFIAVDGAVITHISEAVDPPTKDCVADFLSSYNPEYPLDPAYGPITKAEHIAPSLIGPEQRKRIDFAMKSSKEVIRNAWLDFDRYVGRRYDPFIEKTLMEDAEIVLICMGAYTKDAIYAARKMRSKGVKAGVIRLRYLRPFPFEELKDAINGINAIGVLDFSYSYGSPCYGGVLYNEIRSALYGNIDIPIVEFILVGGREPTIKNFERAIEIINDAAKGKDFKNVNWLTLRGEDI